MRRSIRSRMSSPPPRRSQARFPTPRPAMAAWRHRARELAGGVPHLAWPGCRALGARHQGGRGHRGVTLEKLPPPVIPGNFYAAGLNYRAHIEWANSRGGNYKVPEQADIGYRSNNALIGSGQDIVIPADSTGPVEYEGELVAVIGREANSVSEAR